MENLKNKGLEVIIPGLILVITLVANNRLGTVGPLTHGLAVVASIITITICSTWSVVRMYLSTVLGLGIFLVHLVAVLPLPSEDPDCVVILEDKVVEIDLFFTPGKRAAYGWNTHTIKIDTIINESRLQGKVRLTYESFWANRKFLTKQEVPNIDYYMMCFLQEPIPTEVPCNRAGDNPPNWGTISFTGRWSQETEIEL